MKLLAVLFLAVALPCALFGQANVIAALDLQFGLRRSDVEKRLGEGRHYRRHEEPERAYSETYYPRSLKREDRFVHVTVTYDRDYCAMEYRFTLVVTSNGGIDPRTGQRWEMSAELRRQILAAFPAAEPRIAADSVTVVTRRAETRRP